MRLTHIPDLAADTRNRLVERIKQVSEPVGSHWPRIVIEHRYERRLDALPDRADRFHVPTFGDQRTRHIRECFGDSAGLGIVRACNDDDGGRRRVLRGHRGECISKPCRSFPAWNYDGYREPIRTHSSNETVIDR
jgi:hypothetical protein